MPGYQIRHNTVKSGLVLVPLADQPLFIHHQPKIGKDECPTCRQIHLVKTVHLFFDLNGACIVSKGVLKLLQKAGMPQMTLGSVIKNPPNLVVDGSKTRQQMDQENSAQRYWTPLGNKSA